MYGRYPQLRMRRLRQNAATRNLTGSALPPLQKMLWPVFVIEGTARKEPIDSLPGQYLSALDPLLKALETVGASGVHGILLFGHIDSARKDIRGAYAYCEDGLVQRAVRKIRDTFPRMLVFTDVCLCGYTDHGHCGPVDATGIVNNDETNLLLAQTAVSHAAAGAHGVAPSAMMDGQVTAIRQALAENGLDDTILMSYSTKFASAMYGPFRDAAGSAPSHGDRTAYQAPYTDARQAIRESLLDEAEGADILMVKPALFYLDIINRIRNESHLPLAAYNVSGEYAMIHAAARNGWGDLHAMAREALTSIGRAGADIIITYWANQYSEIFDSRNAS